jgi:hypothetical protein
MKTLTDIKQDMSELYEAVKAGTVDLKTAGELANISGKFLKAEQLELATAVFLSTPLPRRIEQAPQITDASHEH